MNLRTITIITAIGLIIKLIMHFALFPYEALADYPRNWVWFVTPIITDLPLSAFLFTLYSKQK